MTTAVIVVAAGNGTRLGLGPKAFVTVAGRSLLELTLERVNRVRGDVEVVVVAPASHLGEAQRLASGARVVPGGATRQQSVAAGLRALGPDVQRVLVHDAARALTPTALFDAVADAVAVSNAGVIPALAVADTIKRIDADGTVLGTVDRSELAAVQTPQGFPRDQLDLAYSAVEADHTDDAAVFAASGRTVIVIPGDPLAFKVTTPDDLARAEQQLARSEPHVPAVRTGIGIDVHAFGGDAELRLAGLSWPGEQGLAGHSDGDAVAHAICDALLSAAGLGDIGSRFGTDDPRYAGAAGEVFLTGTVALLAEAGFAPSNVSVQLVAQRPRFSARRIEAEAALSALVGAPVSIAATTSDGLGFTGRSEGVAAIATALIRTI
ncbi:2-C-methyl-D-erythritol 2,4-cyclodiphosphate synthase [Naasia lichenicola]|uniref:Bifunctional enzyme IspD/IspF n=1 Tax=Naasia lichenicola TaxID=2565933 RepID=A0A4S4FHM9_9MICO|nr:2-C-methyl-D-erythritol 4-phosphate cytidylyltransferase [Naasia lichenicola]THG29823.1 2-C-methyl-D-erythritol 2,4-cyclodiphosphate synthase [Naasia lichenicola]